MGGIFPRRLAQDFSCTTSDPFHSLSSAKTILIFTGHAILHGPDLDAATNTFHRKHHIRDTTDSQHSANSGGQCGRMAEQSPLTGSEPKQKMAHHTSGEDLANSTSRRTSFCSTTASPEHVTCVLTQPTMGKMCRKSGFTTANAGARSK